MCLLSSLAQEFGARCAVNHSITLTALLWSGRGASMAQSDAQQAGDKRRRTALRHGSRSPRLSCKGSQVRTKVRASGRHMATYDSCLVTLTGLVLRVLPRLAHSSLRVRTRATYACLASTCWLSITLGALLSADTAQVRISTGVIHGTRARRQRRRPAESPHFASPLCRKAQRRACRDSAGLARTSAGSSSAPTDRDGRGWGACAADLADAIGIAPPL